MEPFYKNRVFTYLIYILLGLASLYLLVQIRPLVSALSTFLRAVLAPFFIAMIISYVLNPIVNLMNTRKVPRTAAVLIIYFVFLISLAVILLNLIPMIVQQFKELNEHLPGLSMKAQNLVDGVNDNKFLPESIREGINKSLVKFENNVSHAVSDYIDSIGDTINMLFVAFIIPFLAFYMLKDFQLIEKTALTLVPAAHRKQTVQLLKDIDEALGNYVRGQFLVCLIVGVLAFLGYWIVGMQYALLLASVVAIFNIIPYLGPFFGAAPALIMASTISWKMVLFVALVNTVVQILEGNMISPQVVGKTLHMHPLVIIFALLAGGELAGITGLILAVPFFAVAKVLIQHVSLYWVNRKQV
ncbi:MAG: permease [Paenibacillaceae bacterium]|jgi:predicted PurR-regulated permease PerM|nr:permease [Paenibacillaceae bacterium]